MTHDTIIAALEMALKNTMPYIRKAEGFFTRTLENPAYVELSNALTLAKQLRDGGGCAECAALKARLGQPAIDALLDGSGAVILANDWPYLTKSAGNVSVSLALDAVRLDKPAQQEG